MLDDVNVLNDVLACLMALNGTFYGTLDGMLGSMLAGMPA